MINYVINDTVVPLTKVHPSYQARFQMPWYSKLLLHCTPLKGYHPSYKTTYKKGTTWLAAI